MEQITLSKTSVMRLYVLYDTLTEESSPLYEATSDVAAIRAFCPLLAETVNPSDYKLYYVGTYDRHSLVVVGCGVPQEVDYTSYYEGWLNRLKIKEVKP